MYRVAILTVSDGVFHGTREDVGSIVIEDIVKQQGWQIADKAVVADEKDEITKRLLDWSAKKIDLVLTTGGTGFSPRDVTPEATEEVIERRASGIVEYMRLKASQLKPAAALSRASCGIRRSTLIINLPGSPKAVRENLGAVVGILPHGLDVLAGRVKNCADKGSG